MGNYNSSHTGTQIDNKIDNTYTKSEIDTQMSNFYTKTETDNLLSNKLNLSGGTLSGNLTISKNSNPAIFFKNTDMDTTATSLSADEYNSIYFRDANDLYIGFIQTTQAASDGHSQLQINCRTRNADNSANVNNTLTLRSYHDGTRTVSVSDAKIWRTAISAGVNSMVPKNTYTTVTATTTLSSSPTAWTTFLSNWTAPSNGYLNIYFNGSSNTPAFVINGSSGVECRGNGNGGRDFTGFLPVHSGYTYSAQCIYCKPNWIRFIPADTAL